MSIMFVMSGSCAQDITNDHGAVIFFYPKANTGGCTKQGG